MHIDDDWQICSNSVIDDASMKQYLGLYEERMFDIQDRVVFVTLGLCLIDSTACNELP